jgi:2-isopropylmalate synthase
MNNLAGKYRPFGRVDLKDRQWPNNQITQAPRWCSVDLRDGNQALSEPMTVEQKMEMFLLLTSIGFKEIEVGFPSSSLTDYKFVRRLIDENLIPNDVVIQVLVQARDDLIKRTCESLKGAKRVIIHLYNSTSPAQRRVVFKMTQDQIIDLAVQGTKWVKQYALEMLASTYVSFEYSPESFSATELEFSLRICEAVMDEWKPTPQHKIVLNLPETVQVASSNVYADQIEWFRRHLSNHESAIISVHTHNDCGTGVASTELAILAGADRVEGTLFGNGERTGNLDIVTVALNLYSQGIDPKLDFSNIPAIREVYERCTGMVVPDRHPYSGDLVFTAFSGSHQDAIAKGLKEREKNPGIPWDVAYLKIDPRDIGREYSGVIRVNGQSGKRGMSHLLETIGIRLPPDMLREFSLIAKIKIDALGREVTAQDLKAILWEEFVERKEPYELISLGDTVDPRGHHCCPSIIFGSERLELEGSGNGPIDSFVRALQGGGIHVHVIDQAEHAIGMGEDAVAIGYVKIKLGEKTCWGAGVDTDIMLASAKAVISALNRVH